MHRRQFLTAVAASAVLPWRQLHAATVRPRIRAFSPAQVRLRPGPMLDAAEVNRRFVLGQDPARLLHNFRVAAGLASTARPLGGWEAPDNELRGHYVGHYLSACALLWASFGDAQAKQRGDQIVAGLAECQRVRGSGYLSAFPEELFDRLRDNRPAWAPFYTLHKILRAEPTKPRTIPEYKADGLPTPSLTGHAPWVRADDARPLSFRTADRRELVPLYQILDERYAVYFKTPS
jgi:hypothetical protein